MSANSSADLQRIYQARFADSAAYRKRVWQVLIPDFFQRYVRADAVVLDLGCGYGEFINEIRCGKKLAMDLNPDAPIFLGSDVQFLEQDCSTHWQLPDDSLDIVFTSNFFEHLPSKDSLGRTLDEAFRCLKLGGRLIALGPNIRYTPGAYWDFWDHHLPLTGAALSEGLSNRGFEIERCVEQFLPYTMVKARQYAMFFVKAYLRLPFIWRFVGKQFLVIARKPVA